MQRATYKIQTTYVVVPGRRVGRTRSVANLTKLRKEITRAWRGEGAVEEIRAQRGRQSLA